MVPSFLQFASRVVAAGAPTRQAQRVTLGSAWQQRRVSTEADGAGASTSAIDASPSSSQHTALANKLLYRSKQRGFLELDLLVGLWAEREVPQMDTTQLHQLAVVLDQENPDLFKWLTGQLPPPAHMLQNAAFLSLRKSAAEQLAERSPENSRSAPGREWVRGWDDSWRQKSGQEATPDATKSSPSL